MTRLDESTNDLFDFDRKVAVPPNRIPAGCKVITAEMLPLIEMSAEEITGIVVRVPGGAANVQD
ncbi:MAG TPA: hypothetical protein VK638_30725, partial [Edaphobacter sp.]|nr:hypothetical protein [Edaphobacter sp.]